MLFYPIGIKHSLVLSDSMVRGFRQLKKTDVICRRGADPKKLFNYIQDNKYIVARNYKVVIIHIGTNYFGSRYEWGKYLELVNQECTFEEYYDYINSSSLLPAKASTFTFRDEVFKIIKLIQSLSTSFILLSGIIPRPWDIERRQPIVKRFNQVLKSLESEEDRVIYIETPKVFHTKDGEIVTRYFDWDGLHLNEEGSKQLQSLFGEKIWTIIDKYCL